MLSVPVSPVNRRLSRSRESLQDIESTKPTGFVLCPVRDCHGTHPRNDSKSSHRHLTVFLRLRRSRENLQKGCSTGFRGTSSLKYPDYSGRFSERIALTPLSKADFSR